MEAEIEFADKGKPEMDWEQKLHALNALGEVLLAMRKPGDWYVQHRDVEIGDGRILSSPCVRNAPSPVAAVLNYWQLVTTNLKPAEKIIIGAYTERRREVRWNGFMWRDV